MESNSGIGSGDFCIDIFSTEMDYTTQRKYYILLKQLQSTIHIQRGQKYQDFVKNKNNWNQVVMAGDDPAATAKACKSEAPWYRTAQSNHSYKLEWKRTHDNNRGTRENHETNTG